MTSRMILGATLAIVSLVFASGCSFKAKKKPPADDSSKALLSLGVGSFTTVEFPKGQSRLTDWGQRDLQKFIQRVRSKDFSIEEIKVLAWSDQEYPLRTEKISPRDVILANERVAEVTRVLEKNLKGYDDIQTYNMARRPGSMSEFFNTDEYDVKKSVETSGATSTTNEDGELSYSKASKAIVIIEYKD
jgi:DNA-binding transcriptional MerR regulator